MPVEVIPAQPGDHSQAVVLMREFYDYFPDLNFDEDRSPAALKGLIDNPTYGSVFLIKFEGQLAGYAAVAFSYHLEFFGRIAWLDEFYIRESFRGSGLGTQVVERIAGELRKKDFKALFLELDKKNEGGERLYRRLGFQPRHIYEANYKTL